ncbi:hypothetical protein MJO29_016613 [Puccinia striiformis f. sp. tritici]|nr:hypothetical protein MJO29_016613 [Puccinia striiformis f. sp. tritici]
MSSFIVNPNSSVWRRQDERIAEGVQTLDDPQGYLKQPTVNRNSLLIQKTHPEGSTLRMINPDNTIKAKLPKGTPQQKLKMCKGKITIGIAMMPLEKQISEELIGHLV